MFNLKRFWLEVSRKLGIDQKKAEIIFSELCEKYAEPQRYYHNLSHISSCFEDLEIIFESLKDPLAVAWALMFHDAVYNPKMFGWPIGVGFATFEPRFAVSNEGASAELAITYAKETGLSTEFQDKVARMILATESHMHVQSGDSDIQALLDIDLAILGKCKEIFERYEEGIRKEYKFISNVIFRKSRAKILKKFLQRDRIYQTEFFREKYEVQARLNLKSAINKL